MQITTLTLDEITPDIQVQISELYAQLNPDNSQRSLAEILVPENTVHIFVCEIENRIVATALLSTYKVISGYRGMVDDVVVDREHRGKGIGKKLMQQLIAEGQKIGLDEILLFSGHHRKPAIALYQSLGFTLRDSGLYNLRLA